MMPDTVMTYRFVWKNNAERKALYGQICRIIEPRQAGHVLVEFENGQRITVNPRALRRNQGSKSKNAKKTKKAKPAAFGDYFATIAISQLTRIPKNDPMRIEALLRVRDYVTEEITSE
jgi:sRNA-binding protein